jgi:hypothetical protein
MKRRREESIRGALSSEAAFVDCLASFLKGLGYAVLTEVPNFGQRVDLVASRGRRLTAIEAKLSHWRRAIGQCQAHEAVADYICVAVAMKRVPEALMAESQVRGYGLILFDHAAGGCVWKIRPRLNKFVWRPQRRAWAEQLRALP